MAAHIEKKGVSILDQVGIAQKGGAVLSHIKIANDPKYIHSAQISESSTNLLLGCDIVVSASKEVRSLLDRNKTNAIINNHETPLSQFVLDSDFSYSTSLTSNLIKNNTEEINQINASEISKSLSGSRSEKRFVLARIPVSQNPKKSLSAVTPLFAPGPTTISSEVVALLRFRLAVASGAVFCMVMVAIPASPMMLGHLDYVERYDRDEVEKEHPAQIPPQESC